MTTPERRAAAFDLEQIKDGYNDRDKADKSFWQGATMMLDEAADRLLDPTTDQAIIQKINDFNRAYTTKGFGEREVTVDDISAVNGIIEETVRALKGNLE